ncbi:MAG TPA: DUF1554 domain-containing protein [Labilithrix sp.]|nr:DUF1554 domain-containing protein [Labilithrix sp.]
MAQTAYVPRRRRGTRALARVTLGSVFAAILAAGCNAISGVGELAIRDGVEDGLVEEQGDGAGVRQDVATNADAPVVGDAAKDADAGSIQDGPSPTDAPAGDTKIPDAKPDVAITAKRVFVTSGQLTGNMGGVAGGDNLCAQAASSAGLGGTWVAWLSTSSKEAIDRITYDGKYIRLDGVEVVANKAQLASANLTNAISITELKTPLGTDPSYTKDVWTGRNASKSSGSSCNDWTSSNSLEFGTRGHSVATATPDWTQVPGFSNGGWGCQVACSVYCFEL